jgi:hypothetical protein
VAGWLQEPNFTNYAQVRGGEPFVDTLDYVFVSRQWGVREVLALPHRDDMAGAERVCDACLFGCLFAYQPACLLACPSVCLLILTSLVRMLILPASSYS